jgi:hypothetical protein
MAGRWLDADDVGNGLKVQRVKVGFGGEGSFQDVDVAHPMPVATDGVPDGALTGGWDGASQATTGYGSALISVNSLSGGDTIVVKGSLTGANPKVVAVTDLGSTTAGNLAASITTDGLYLVPAAGQLTYVKTGTASTPTVNVMLKR